MVRVSYIYYHINPFLRVHIILAWCLLELRRNDPLKVDRSDPLKLGCDEFTTIVGEEMGGGKKVAHRRDRLHCGIYAHAAWYSGAARHPYPNSLPG